jgi:ABC-type cobalt transport system substrate-binding protein
MYRKLERNILFFLLTVLAAMFVYFALTWKGFYGGADNIAHYRISRYAFDYPYLFLDHWGKPLFTLLTAPFSQFGFIGSKLFNVFAGLLAALFAYLTAKKLEFRNSLLVLIFTIFAPIYFVLLPTGLTEPLFSLVLILSIFLFFNRQYISSAIFVSFLPFARTEGVFLLPLFFLAFLWERKFLAVLLIFTGTVLYSLAGYFHFGDIFWLINNNPYTGARDIYGNGELLHFVKASEDITGLPVAILLLIGTIFLVIESVGQKIPSERKQAHLILLLIATPFFLYLAAHSYAWWKGHGGSLGLIRVMAGVVPLAALLALKGYNSLSKVLRLPVFLKSVVSLALLAMIVYGPVKKYRTFPLGEEEKLVAEAAEWLKESDYFGGKIYYYHLYFIHFLEIDPFDKEKCVEKIPPGEVPSSKIPAGSMIQWDSHFGPNEGRMPLSTLMNDPGLMLLKTFAPKTALTNWKGENFKVYLFLKMDKPEQQAVED